jgi:hypothetical protein
MISILFFIGLIISGFVLFVYIMSMLEGNKVISLHVLVDNDGRITYTGSYKDCKNQLTKDLKLIKLEGILE